MLKKLVSIYILISIISRTVGGVIQILAKDLDFPFAVYIASASSVVFGIIVLIVCRFFIKKRVLLYPLFLIFDSLVTVFNIIYVSKIAYITKYSIPLIGSFALVFINLICIGVILIPQKYVVKKIEADKADN
ncbi:MAG: hypothetical protein J5874_02765 [Oscillospiraceae bacterium]|nr:hypothetical protein [Oscillospiraceae bacterium]